MLTDIQISQSAKMLKINEIAKKISLNEDELEPYGWYKAKLNLSILDRLKDKKDGNLILVSAITPTPAGEGKSTLSIGLSQALNSINKSSIVALREPSLGPVFGLKGGASGGGYSQVLPMEDINLHFTGDFHAITSANNLICACIDNHITQGNPLNIDPTKILFKRVLDMNDRSLRKIVIGLGGKANGFVREDSFQITVASEIMAVLCLCSSLQDLKQRIERILLAYTYDDKAIFVKDLGIAGAVCSLLKDAIKPNLVQTIENTPAIIHGGPFANIAHGCNSILATKMALKLSDYVVTEAGFGADLGAEKFLNIKCRFANLRPKCVVLLATIRALKHHGGAKDFNQKNLDALKAGFANLDKHIENILKFKIPVVVAINKFTNDSDEEINELILHCENLGIKACVCEVWEKGSKGGIDLANEVVKACQKDNEFEFLYNENLSIEEKIEIICTQIYGSDGVEFSSKAKKDLQNIKKLGFDNLLVCMSKTHKSISDKPNLLARPSNFIVNIDEIKISSGAGFVVAMAGGIIDMPGLPKTPAAQNIDIDDKGIISGLF